MIEHASGVAKAYISLTTNGTLVGRYKERLLDSPLDFIYISINGYNAQDYARLTGMPGQYFKEIADNTAELMKLKGLRKKKMPQIWLSFITDNKNYLFLREMYGLAEHLGVDGMIILPFIPSPQEGFRPLERCLFSDTPGVLEEFRKIKKIGKGPQVKLSLRLLDKNMLSQGSKFKYCRAPFHTLTVDGEGNIGGCGCQLLDNSHNGKFWEKDAWNNPYFQQLRRRFLSSELPVLEPCTWCHNNSPHKV
jgi:MoaA/NifB/PqqE/SkfB family radical SAM enzyme